MAESAEQLGRELSDVLELIRRSGGGVVFDELPEDPEEDALQAEEMDSGRAGEALEARCVAQRGLIEEANRLAETLDRLRRGELRIGDAVGELVTAGALRGLGDAREVRI